MRRFTITTNGGTYDRISKFEARKRFSRGEPIVICSSAHMPTDSFASQCHIDSKRWIEDAKNRYTIASEISGIKDTAWHNMLEEFARANLHTEREYPRFYIFTSREQIYIDLCNMWHGGQSSAMYSFASTNGKIHSFKHLQDLINEVNYITRAIDNRYKSEDLSESDKKDRKSLGEFYQWLNNYNNIELGAHFKSEDTNNIFKVVEIHDNGLIGVSREVSSNHWDYGHFYWWNKEAFDNMIKVV